MNLIDKIKLLFTAKKAVDQFQAGPKSSFLTGEFWAKVGAAICTVWAGAAGFVPHPVDIYITVGLALLMSIERLYLKSKHLDAVINLSNAPTFDPAQFTQSLGDLLAKFPKLGTVVSVADVTKNAQALVDASNVLPNAPVAATPFASSSPAGSSASATVPATSDKP